MSMILDGTLGATFNDGSNQPAAASPYVLKNRLINGAMQIWQRGTTFTISGGTYTYTLDRWNNGFQNGTYSQSSSVPSGAGFQYSLSIASNSASYGSIQQRIESFNTQDLVGQVITVSFWALASVGGASGLNISLAFPTAVDNYTSTTSIFTANTSALTGSWVKYTTSFNGTVMPSGVANGLQLTIYNPAGGTSAITWLITGVQLEIGSSATPFERRLYNQELANCQRYLPAYNGSGAVATGFCAATTQAFPNVIFPVTARVAPTGITVSNATYFSVYSSGAIVIAATSITFNTASTTSGLIAANVASGLVAGNATVLTGNNAAAQLLFTGCEL